MPAPRPYRIPVSTYRLQFRRDFTFRDARALVPYLSELGITDCYCSPLLAASPGSPHGYDVCDHNQLNPEYGTWEDFVALAEALAAHQMGLIVDFVPNHMGAHPVANRSWRDVLESGPSSLRAHYFDIDWDPVKPELRNKVLLPVLGDQYGAVLERGELRLRFEDGRFSVDYFDLNFPLNLRQTRGLLRAVGEGMEAECSPGDADLEEFQSILFQLDRMPPFTVRERKEVLNRNREKEKARERLAKLARNSPRVQRWIEESVRVFNGQPGNPESYDLLHQVLDAQPYRLSDWHTAQHEINYRRFFDINELIALRMEDPEVFEATHRLIFYLIAQGLVTGLRLDHVDGLFDPPEYLRRLNAAVGRERPIYIVGEKVLSTGERLREDWLLHGTTGYDFLNDLNGLYVAAQNSSVFRKIYERFVGEERLFADVAYESRKLIATTSLASELNMLAHELNRISETNRRFRDYTLPSLQESLREVVACFPWYRTYCSARGWDESDRKTVDTAVARAVRRNPALEASIFQFLRCVLLPDPERFASEAERERVTRFAMKFQQYTGPVQAKGLEDTAFYRYAALLSLNEVGGDPARFGRSPEEFHRANADRLRNWPYAMLATSTHDTKRGEDHRARLNVLSEIPAEWRTMIFRWSRANAGMRTLVNGLPAPDRNEEYIFYQGLIGSWPPEMEQPEAQYVERMRQFMLKAIREEKTHTSWLSPSPDYENAVLEFVRRTLTGSRAQRFLRLFLPFARRVAWLGMVNSVSQLVLKLASPGVPDFYQGTELWDLALVDPDNRRLVDYELRIRRLNEAKPLLEGCREPQTRSRYLQELLAQWFDGRIKLFLTASGLRLRRRWPELFTEGDYVPLSAEGEKRDHVVAFARRHGEQSLVVIAPRLVAKLLDGQNSPPLGKCTWGETTIRLPTELAGHRYQDFITGEPVEITDYPPAVKLAGALATLPVAWLLGQV